MLINQYREVLAERDAALKALALIAETTDSDLVALLGLTPHILAGRLLAVHELAREAIPDIESSKLMAKMAALSASLDKPRKKCSSCEEWCNRWREAMDDVALHQVRARRLIESYEAKVDDFARETRRSSDYAALLSTVRIVLLNRGCYSAPWPKACALCHLITDIDAALRPSLGCQSCGGDPAAFCCWASR